MSQGGANNQSGGGGGGGITTIQLDTGSITGSTVTLYANNFANDAGSSVSIKSTSSSVGQLYLTDDNGNTILGKSSGMLSGNQNSVTGVGQGSLQQATLAQNVTFVGSGCFGNGQGQPYRSVALGQGALAQIATGPDDFADYNLAVGYFAGQNYTSSESNNTVIQNSGVLGDNHTLRISSTGTDLGQVTRAFIGGAVGATQPTNNNLVGTWNTVTDQVTLVPDGTSGQFLTTDGSGNISWTTGGGGGSGYPYSVSNVLGQANFTSIQAAINQAVTDGHTTPDNPATVWVWNGIYPETVTLAPFVNVNVMAQGAVATGDWTFTFTDASQQISLNGIKFAPVNGITALTVTGSAGFGVQANFICNNCDFQTTDASQQGIQLDGSAWTTFTSCQFGTASGSEIIVCTNTQFNIFYGCQFLSPDQTSSIRIEDPGYLEFLGCLLNIPINNLSSVGIQIEGCDCEYPFHYTSTGAYLWMLNSSVFSTDPWATGTGQINVSNLATAGTIDPAITIVQNDTKTQLTNISFDGGATYLKQDGQVWIGSTASFPVPANITGSGGIVINNGSNTINVDGAGVLTDLTFAGDLGTANPSGGVINIVSGFGSRNSGETVLFRNSGSTSRLDVTDGALNTTIGLLAGNSVMGNLNTSVGWSTLTECINGAANCAFGVSAMQHAIGSSYNVAIGWNAGQLLANGSENVLIGTNAGNASTDGSELVIIGSGAGINYTGAETSNIVFGWDVEGVTGESNVLRIGNATGVSDGNLNSAYIQGIYSNVQDQSATVQAVTVNNTTGQLGVTSIPLSAYPYSVSLVAGQARFTSIQAAINQASTDGFGTGNPATVWVWNGDYSETVTLVTGINMAALAQGANITGQWTFTCTDATDLISIDGFSFSPSSGTTAITLAGVSGAGFDPNFKVNNCFFSLNGSGTLGVALGGNAFTAWTSCIFNASGGSVAIDCTNTNWNLFYGSTLFGDNGSVTLENPAYLEFIGCFVDIPFLNSAPFSLLFDSCDLEGNFQYIGNDPSAYAWFTNCSVFSSNTFWATGQGTITYSNMSTQGVTTINGSLTVDNDPFTALVSSSQNLSFDGGGTKMDTDGQVWIGSSSGNPAPALITGSGGITITNGSNTINVDGAGVTDALVVTGDTGTASPSAGALTIFANNATNTCGSSVLFSNSGSTSTLLVTDSAHNTLIGQSCGVVPNTASNCTGLGQLALAAITDDLEQVAIGFQSMLVANDGEGNTAVGTYSLATLQSSGFNTSIGNRSGLNLVNGNFNLFLGYLSGQNYTSVESSNILLSNLGVTAENNVMRLGTTGNGALQVNQTYIAGVVGATQPVNGNQVATWNNTSEQVTLVTDGTSGQVLSTDGSGNLSWVTPSGSVSDYDWSVNPSSSVTLTSHVGYILTNSGAISVALPTSSFAQDEVAALVLDVSGGSATITCGTGQSIKIGNKTYTTSVSSVDLGACLILVCTTAASGSNGSWRSVATSGNWSGS